MGQNGMSYVLGGLPLNVPLWVVVTDGGRAWQGQAANAHRLYQANGWGGKITIQPGSTTPVATNWYEPQQTLTGLAGTPVPGGGTRPNPKPGTTPKPLPRIPFPPAGNNPTGAGGVSGVDFSMSL
jgi:hypothetical protein